MNNQPSLLDRIIRDTLEARYQATLETGNPPEISVYLGMKQRTELYNDFHQTHFGMAPYKAGEVIPADPSINGCKIYFVTKDDHYNIAVGRK